MVHHYWEDAVIIIPQTYHSRKYKPGKRTILVAVSLSFLLLLSQIFYSFNLTKPSGVSVSKLYQSMQSLNELVDPPSCVKNYLGNRKPLPKAADTCQHLAPPRGFCSLIQELFFDRQPESCDHQREITFCKKIDGMIKCEIPAVCKGQGIFTGFFDSQKGDTIWKEIVNNKLQEEVLTITQSANYKGFVFIKCTDKSNTSHPRDLFYDNVSQEEISDESSYFNQLFILPAKPYPSSSIARHNAKSFLFKDKFININLIMIDSVSRDHFYRSLPESISLLDHLRDNTDTDVLDFQYVQSLKQRTYENLKALFSGYVDTFEKPFGTYDMPTKQLPLSVLLSQLKENSYKTLWLEDMCWTWEWGLAKDLKVVNKSLNHEDLWVSFKNALNAANIDDVDLTLASCEILDNNGRKDPFHDAPAVCFNGKYHHEYLFEYLHAYQENYKESVDHSFTFLQTNVAHDETGIRIQSLDKTLKIYLQYAATLKNTITILFSDHGSTYGEFLRRSPEAYIETFNPFLFFIIPNDVKKEIGDVKVRILNDNQKNLISLLDVHETILALTGCHENKYRSKIFKERYIIPNGLLSNIPTKRTCDDIPIIMPNLCICKNFDMTVESSEMHYALAEFSMGILNNIIVNQRTKSGQRGFGNCQLLVVKEIRKVREERKSSELINYKLDLKVTGILMPDLPELFFVTVEVGLDIPSIRLISYERISSYSSFRSCQDNELETKMCVCEKMENSFSKRILSLFIPNIMPSIDFFRKSTREDSEKQIRAFFDIQSPYMKSSIFMKHPDDNPCFFIVQHLFISSFNIYAINLCSSLIKISLVFTFNNILLSDQTVSNHIVHFLDVKHLIAGTKSNSKLESSWSYKIHISTF